jgi:hypothetical protein
MGRTDKDLSDRQAALALQWRQCRASINDRSFERLPPRRASLASSFTEPKKRPQHRGEAGAEVQRAGREEKADTLSILVVGHQFPIYIMVYEAPQLVCNRHFAGRPSPTI